MLNAVSGSVGLVVQIALFVGVYLLTASSRGRARALLYGSIAAVYGYALVASVAMLTGVTWQVANFALALVLASTLLDNRVRSLLHRDFAGLVRLLKSAWGAVSIVSVVVGIQVVIVTISPELSVDGQLYHGPILAQMLQSGGLWGWDAPNQYMFYTDLTMAGGVNLAAFAGATIFDNGLQIPHLLVLIFAVNLALTPRFRRAWIRVAFAAVIVTAPVVWLQPRILYVDLAYGAAVATLIVLIVLTSSFRLADVLVASTAGAAVLATKPTGILTGALLLAALLIVAVWRRRREGMRWRAACGPAFLVALVPVFAAGAFYVRNLVSFGNPVYPVQVSMGPLRLPGLIDLSIFASGDRGSGLIDFMRLGSYGSNIARGIMQGVTKPDYDPRAGGFGSMPLMVLGLAAVLITAQIFVVVWRRSPGGPLAQKGAWVTQAGMIGLAFAVLAIQPSTFDSRYVIGPTTVFACAMLITKLTSRALLAVDACVASIALVFAGGQIAWTEMNADPGASAVLDLRAFPAKWQPATPGNPWGRAASIAWLPSDSSECARIALQTAGGVAGDRLGERSLFGTLPYGLYGESLCNRVLPVGIFDYLELADGETTRSRDDVIPTSDYLLFYAEDEHLWRELFPELSPCWQPLGNVNPVKLYPQAVIVLSNTCR